MNPAGGSAIPTTAPVTPQTAVPGAAPAADPSEFGNYSDWAQQEMAKGFTADQLKQTLAEGNITPGAAAAAGGAAPAGAPDNSPWWQKILPTAGGILGGIVGIPGDLFSGGLSSVAGATAGGALGQGLENLLSGKNPVDANDLSSGIENGVGQLVGGGVGKVVGALGSGLAGAGEKGVQAIADNAAADAAAKSAIDDATATKLNYGGIHDNTANALELGKSQQFVKGMGFDHTNPYDMQKVGNGGQELNNVYDRALTNAAPVETTDINKAIFPSTTANAAKLTPAEVAQLEASGVNPEAIKTAQVTGGQPAVTIDPSSPTGQALADFSKQTGVDLTHGLPANMPATQVRQLQQAIGRQIGNQQTILNNAELNGIDNTAARGELTKLNNLYSQLGDKVKTPEVNTAVGAAQVSDADRAGLVAKYGDSLGNHIADTVNNAKSADDLLGPMQDFTKMSRASRMAINDIENVTNSPRALARTKFAVNGGVVTPGAVSAGNPTVDAVTAAATASGHPVGAVLNVANKIHKAGLTPQIAKGLGNVMQRTAPLVAPATVAAAGLPTMAGAQGSAIPTGAGGDQSMQPGQPQAVNPVNSVLDKVLFSLSQPGASLTPGYSSMVQAAQALAPSSLQQEQAAGAVSALAPTYANAGGAQGFGNGLLSKLTAMVPGTAANTYQNQQQAAAAQLAKVLGITPEAAMAMLPQLMQSQQTAIPQQQATGGILSTLTSGLPTQ